MTNYDEMSTALGGEHLIARILNFMRLSPVLARDRKLHTQQLGLPAMTEHQMKVDEDDNNRNRVPT